MGGREQLEIIRRLYAEYGQQAASIAPYKRLNMYSLYWKVFIL